MNYDEIFTFENLLDAHLKARKCKRGKKDIIQFELNQSRNLWALQNRLSNRTYTVSKYHKFNIYEPKEREIQALEYKDRVVQHALCDLYLYPLLTKRFIYDNGACQKGKGTDFAMKRLTHHLSEYFKHHGRDGYILKADIHHYFPSINHQILKNKLKPLIGDSDIYILLEKIIDSYENESGKGIPMGNQTSQLFALYYLDSMDRLIKEQLRVKGYVRYMDDMVLILESKEQAKEILEQMKVHAQTLDLEFNNKTQIFPIKNGVDFLGFHFYVSETGKIIRKVRTASKKRFKKRIKKFKSDYAEGKIELEDIKKSLPGYKGHLQRGHTYKLQHEVYKDFVLKRGEEIIEETYNKTRK